MNAVQWQFGSCLNSPSTLVLSFRKPTPILLSREKRSHSSHHLPNPQHIDPPQLLFPIPPSDSNRPKNKAKTKHSSPSAQGGNQTNPEKQAEQEQLTSLLPLPNPLMTVPSNHRGKGCSGPSSGPAVGSRGPSGRIVFV